MKKLFLKTFMYFLLILLMLELVVRVLHLTKDYPARFVDDYGVEKWIPNQEGYSVTGNRRQNFSKYHINKTGYNSYREFTPTKDKVEIALVGDSFIEGFHQNYYNSIGKKIENKLGDVEVYEFGYAGYDLADQLHMIYKYKAIFDKIDIVILGLKFENDLLRNEYQVVHDRMQLESSLYKKIRQVKLLIYAQNIGVLKPFQEFIGYLSTFGKNSTNKNSTDKIEIDIIEQRITFVNNFKNLTSKYGFDKNRFIFLLDIEITPQIFLDYLIDNNFQYIDFSAEFKASKQNTTLIYDKHWNNQGRLLIANLISNYISKKYTFQ